MRGSPDDSSDNRVFKSSHDNIQNTTRYTVYIFDSLELRRARYGTPVSNDYELTPTTEVPYLLANGGRLARVVYEPDLPESNWNDQHILFELGDHLGSTSTVLDKATSEVVEKSSFMAYGGKESDFRPERWGAFREDYGFTGKEEDVEVGLVYFGKRFYNPLLGRWLNPDPLGVHDPGKADLNLYAYVRGMALKAVDPLGLADQTPADKAAEKAWVQNYKSERSGSPPAGKGPSVGVHAGTGPTATPAAPTQGNSVMQNVLTGAALANAEPPSAIKMNDPNASPQGIPGGHGPKENGSVWAQVAYMGTTLGTAVVGAAVSFAKAVKAAAADAIEHGMQALARNGERSALHPTFQPGPHAGESIPARSTDQTFTSAERAEINRIGETTGCHTCGTLSPGTKSGNFVPDHQPPSALAPEGTPQQLYPQCIGCSREQGLEIARQRRGK